VTAAPEILRRIQRLQAPNTAQVRKLRREWSAKLKNTPGRDVIKLAIALRNLSDTCRWVGYELILHHQQAPSLLTSRDVVRLGNGIHSWDTVDCFAPYIAGPAWREHRIPDRLIHSWARSNDVWWRRAAVVSTVALNVKARGGSGDTPRTLAVCRMLIDDREDMVVKALSWALRSLAARDPEAAREFLAQHSERLAARVIREVRNKLTTGLKNP
jgi:hypothetical protein